MGLIERICRVAGVENPSITVRYCDTTVPFRMPGQWNKTDFRENAVVSSNTVKPEPVDGWGIMVDAPFRTMTPVFLLIEAGEQALRMHGSLVLSRKHVHLRLGKVRQSSRMITVEMGKHDVLDVSPLESERLNPVKSCLFDLTLHSQQACEGTNEQGWLKTVLDPEARIDKEQTIIRLDQKTVKDALGPARVQGMHRSAVEMVDRHRRITP